VAAPLEDERRVGGFAHVLGLKTFLRARLQMLLDDLDMKTVWKAFDTHVM
jgi:hypothetical protein